MISSGINLVMTVIGFSVSTLFIVFVCTRLICARIHLNASRRSFSSASGSDPRALERGVHGLDPLLVANFPTKRYRELCLSAKENAQCTVCLSEYNGQDMLRILPHCGHFFHPTCIDLWLQQHYTCPVCRISLRQLPERKWFMQPMFSSAVRSQFSGHSINSHYCRCMANNHRQLSISHNHHGTDPTEAGRFGSSGGDAVIVGNGNSIPAVDQYEAIKDSPNGKVESQLGQ